MTRPPRRAAVDRAPVGPAVQPGLSVPPPVADGPGTPSSPQRTAAGMPSPETGQEDPGTGNRSPSRPVRERSQSPAGAGQRRATGPSPAGSAAIAAAMSENRGPDSLDAHVRRLCDGLGLLRYHTHDSRRSPSGFPDLVCVGPRGVLFRELKTQRGKVSAEQQEWLDALAAAGQNAGVWHPASLLSGAIAAELAGISAWRTRRGTRCVCDAYGSCPQGCPMCPVCRDDAA